KLVHVRFTLRFRQRLSPLQRRRDLPLRIDTRAGRPPAAVCHVLSRERGNPWEEDAVGHVHRWDTYRAVAAIPWGALKEAVRFESSRMFTRVDGTSCAFNSVHDNKIP